jgi:hypothetical protein
MSPQGFFNGQQGKNTIETLETGGGERYIDTERIGSRILKNGRVRMKNIKTPRFGFRV